MASIASNGFIPRSLTFLIISWASLLIALNILNCATLSMTLATGTPALAIVVR